MVVSVNAPKAVEEDPIVEEAEEGEGQEAEEATEGTGGDESVTAEETTEEDSSEKG